MRVALFGGTFDPPHRGHVQLVRLARKRLALDRVLVAPVAAQPLKQAMRPAGFEDRVAMAQLAFMGDPEVEISLLDAPRPDGGLNYTIDTVTHLRQRLAAGDELFCLVGADSFLTIRKWHRAADLLAACDFIVGARPGFDLDCLEAALPDGVAGQALPSGIPEMKLFELTGPSGGKSRLYLLTDLAEDVSATEIRSALRGEENASGVLVPAVVEYIHAHYLYEHL